MHQLITDHVSRPGVTQQAKLWSALRDFITEFEEGAHRETFSKGGLYRSIIDILTDQLDLFEIAWKCVEVITPLAGMGHYVDRGIYLLHVLKKRLSSSSINRSIIIASRSLDPTSYSHTVAKLAAFVRKERPDLLVQSLPALLSTRPLEFSSVLEVVVDICAAAGRLSAT